MFCHVRFLHGYKSYFIFWKSLADMIISKRKIMCCFQMSLLFQFLYILFFFFKYILLIMLLQLSHFPPLFPLHPEHPLLPTVPLFSSCPWVTYITSLASPFPILFLTSPCLFSTYHLCYLFSVPFPPLSLSPFPVITLPVISISIILFLF